jgi:hypothetical protein
MSGKGITVWSDYRKYDGEYHKGKKHGHGEYTWFNLFINNYKRGENNKYIGYW